MEYREDRDIVESVNIEIWKIDRGKREIGKREMEEKE